MDIEATLLDGTGGEGQNEDAMKGLNAREKPEGEKAWVNLYRIN